MIRIAVYPFGYGRVNGYIPFDAFFRHQNIFELSLCYRSNSDTKQAPVSELNVLIKMEVKCMKDLVYIATKRLESKCCFGESKAKYKTEAKQLAFQRGTNDWLPIFNELIRNKIFSYSSFFTYKKQAILFFKYVENEHPNIRNINGAKTYITEYINKFDSAWTQATKLAALAKVYGVASTDLMELSKRKRENIYKNRFKTKQEETISYENNKETINFCLHTGLRRFEVEHLKGKDFFENNNNCYIRVNGKGGKIREVPITDPSIIEVLKSTPKDCLVFGKVNSHLPIHKYRAIFATNLYKALARPIDKVPFKERYYCRLDRAGDVFDKRAMAIVSKQLGHNRLSVIAGHYLRDCKI